MTFITRPKSRTMRARGLFADLGYPVTEMLAHMFARAVEAADFRPSRNGDGTVPAGAHRVRDREEAMARRRRLLADLGVSGH